MNENCLIIENLYKEYQLGVLVQELYIETYNPYTLNLEVRRSKFNNWFK